MSLSLLAWVYEKKKKKKPNSFWLFWQHCDCLRYHEIPLVCSNVNLSLFLTILWRSSLRAETSCWNSRGKDWSIETSYLWDPSPLLLNTSPTCVSSAQVFGGFVLLWVIHFAMYPMEMSQILDIHWIIIVLPPVLLEPT